MTVIRKLKLKSRVAMALVVMLLLGMMPYNIIIQPTEVEAYGEDAEGKYYYAETWLYDYKYDQKNIRLLQRYKCACTLPR